MKFKSIKISGNLLSEDILSNFAERKCKHPLAAAKSFRWHQEDQSLTDVMMDKSIDMKWEALYNLWDSLCLSFHKMTADEYREKWLLPMLKLLGYNPISIALKTEVYGKTMKVSHKSHELNQPVLMNLLPLTQELESKSPDSVWSPHDSMQKLLNYLSDTRQEQFTYWGIITNGQQIRIIRKYHHQTRKAYIHFNLDEICDTRSLDEFRILYRLLHPSRFLQDESLNCLRMDYLFQESLSAGVKIGEDLRQNVIKAIESLANGFLSANPDFSAKLAESHEALDEFHHNILRLVYRVLFLLFAEQRQLMRNAHELYHKEYSITALRNKIEGWQFIPDDYFNDIWKGLQTTFSMVETGVEDLSVSCFNGELFNPKQIEKLLLLDCPNSVMIQFIRYLTIVDKNESIQRISYTELGVEEIGSIYESLLDYAPQLNKSHEVLNIDDKNIEPGAFFLDPRGKSRKTSGSYYTNQSLVNALIERSLAPLVDERIKTEDTKEKQIEKVLSIRVCDPACGSGAFLIAATEYLGKRLAQLKSDSEDIDEHDLRYFRREALRHCIYGVDLNPLSVELAKISLWLTAFTEDKPLNFLDHHIKCGNSLIGVFPGMDISCLRPEAFVTDNPLLKETAVKLKKSAESIKKSNKNQITFYDYHADDEENEYYQMIASQTGEEDSADEVSQTRQHYETLRNNNLLRMKAYRYNYFTTSFYSLPFLTNHTDPEKYIRLSAFSNFDIFSKEEDLYDEAINHFALEQRFFHWELEFPEIFDEKISQNPGFDCVLGNPPWE
nr:N-6 DNA methylase [Candidatus Cloacimonadota bacterium]